MICFTQLDAKAQIDSAAVDNTLNSISNFLNKVSPERIKYYQKKYEITTTKPFEEVFQAIKTIFESGSCLLITKTSKQDDKGNYKGTIQSDFCVFVSESDYTYDSLDYYSMKVPIIRGAVWKNGRVQYKFLLKELEDASVNIVIKAEISGYEGSMTNEVHFWESNGYFEHRMMQKIKESLGMKE
jgi:hypothetical protein